MNWHTYFMDIARVVATKSKDRSKKVGCVIVGPDHEIRSTGYNGFPRGIDESDEIRWGRPIKYSYLSHAEENSVFHAARIGVSLKHCVAYVQSPPCTRCARAFIQAGILTVIISRDHPFKDDPNWQEDLQFAQDLLKEAHICVLWVD